MIEINLVKNADGSVAYAEVTEPGRKLTATADASGIKISGNRRSMTKEMLDILNFVFPTRAEVQFNIPQPLQVTQVQGGKTIFFDGGEDLLKWYQVAATVAIDNTNAFSESNCLKLSAAAGGGARARRFFPMPRSGRISFENIFSFDDYSKLDNFAVYLVTQGGTYQHISALGYFPNSTGWNKYIQGGSFTVLNDLNPPSVYETKDNVGGAWFKSKLAIDFSNKVYLYAEVEDKRTEFGGLGIDIATPAAHDYCSYIDLYVKAVAGQNVNGYFDNLKLSEL